ncbi:gamma-glutamyltransferase [Desulfitibacter alkalitolerans]|uniref:gamma-glutamyltransferase n=1 Tax=Desulfitibacter alkalitolerans TaxID=264641 RepID=UPI000481DB8D|nr:gamma-glutamyltransferase [Desulfitibacter alkalitolerans]
MIEKDKTASSPYGMVSTASGPATDAGVQMLEKGGNAIDAAVAAAFCLGVSEPQASGMGGQSMVLVHLAEKNRTFILDGSSRAPFGIHPENIISSEKLKYGITATTVPSTPAVLGYLLENYGALTLKEVLEPAIAAAQEGFRISSLQHTLINRELKKLACDEYFRKNYLKNDKPPNAGDIVRQPELAKCMERMAVHGWQDFYHGEIGELILKDMADRGGLISQADLSQIPIPIERQVLEGSYRNNRIATFPPPGAGRALIKILNVMENFQPEELEPETPLASLIFALTFKAALRTRQKMPVDPDLFFQLANKVMLDKEYAKEIAKRLKKSITYCLPEIPHPKTSGETTHLSVADKDGNMVGITQSIELVFGSKTTASGLGFFYNNYMSAYEYKDMTHPYYLLPGARPWSSVAPTIIFEEEKPKILLGSPGSERIATTLAQVISRLFDAKQNLSMAVVGPRLHSSSNGKVQIELKRFPEETINTLKRARFDITKRGAYSFYLGCVQAVLYDMDSNRFFGVSDPRRDGTARGPRSVAALKRGDSK